MIGDVFQSLKFYGEYKRADTICVVSALIIYQPVLINLKEIND